MLGAAVVVSVYIPFRHLGGASVGLLMPLLLSAYEWLWRSWCCWEGLEVLAFGWTDSTGQPSYMFVL